jgi:hypothetical protein
MRYSFLILVPAFLLLAHGIAHLVGFLASFRLLPADKMPHVTTVFDGRIDLGERGIRAVGLLWLAAAAAFAVVATLLVLRVAWWPEVTLLVALGSLALCITGWPRAKIGVFVDLAVIALAVAAMGWLP